MSELEADAKNYILHRTVVLPLNPPRHLWCVWNDGKGPDEAYAVAVKICVIDVQLYANVVEGGGGWGLRDSLLNDGGDKLDWEVRERSIEASEHEPLRFLVLWPALGDCASPWVAQENVFFTPEAAEEAAQIRRRTAAQDRIEWQKRQKPNP